MGVPVLRIDQSDESPQETPLVIVLHHEDTHGVFELLNVVWFHDVSEEKQKGYYQVKNVHWCRNCISIPRATQLIPPAQYRQV